MTKEERVTIIDSIDDIAVHPEEFMTLTEIEAYVRGFRDARNCFVYTIDDIYRTNKTD